MVDVAYNIEYNTEKEGEIKIIEDVLLNNGWKSLSDSKKFFQEKFGEKFEDIKDWETFFDELVKEGVLYYFILNGTKYYTLNPEAEKEEESLVAYA